MSHFDDVGTFHKKFGLCVTEDGRPPGIIDPDTFLFRLQFIMEEVGELMQAHRARDLPKVADALADLVYVALGMAHLYSIPFDLVFAEVQRANMQKERATGDTDPRTKRGSALDVVKPEGWRPPDIAGILKSYQKERP